MDTYVRDSIIHNHLNAKVLRNHEYLNNSLTPSIALLFDGYFVKKKFANLLDKNLLNGNSNVVDVLKIVLLTNYFEYGPEKYDIYYSILEKFYFKHGLQFVEEFPELHKAFESLSNKEIASVASKR